MIDPDDDDNMPSLDDVLADADADDFDDDFPSLDDDDEPVMDADSRADEVYQARKEAEADALAEAVAKPAKPAPKATEPAPVKPQGGNSGVSSEQLRSVIERVERVNEAIKNLQDDRKEIFAEAKGTGLDVKAIRTIVKMRKMDKAERDEEQATLDLYLWSLGMAE